MAKSIFAIGLYLFSLLSFSINDGEIQFCSSEKDITKYFANFSMLEIVPSLCIERKFLRAKYSDRIVDEIKDNSQINQLRCACFNEIKKNNDLYRKPSETDKKQIRREKIADLIERSVENLAQHVMPVFDLSPASVREVAPICSVTKITQIK